MLQDEERERKQGALTVLALFIAVLFGQGGVASAAELDNRATRLGQSDAARQGAILRTIARGTAEEADPDDALAALPPLPRVQRDRVSFGPANEAAPRDDFDSSADRPLPYRARAPPAA